jgi:hypothetical protein
MNKIQLFKIVKMKKSAFIILSLLLSAAVFGQPQMKIASGEHDFGKFKEESGRQTFNFEVTNTGNEPLVIQNIVASCGCTTPDWTRTPIPPNGKGVITAIYDPTNRPGIFNKTLTVYTNSKPELVVLVIKGEVIPREKTVEELFIWPLGGVRFESNHLAFTKMSKSEIRTRTMQVINTSKEPQKIEFEGVPDHLTLKANPAVLEPGQKGVIEGTWDANKDPRWGTNTDMVRVKLNGILQENTYFVASSTLVEDFSNLSKEELASAPIFKLENSSVDLGPMDPGTTKEVEFKFTNGGERDLIIRYIRPTCGCTAIQQGGSTNIKSGESGTIKATFNSGSYKGKVVKVIYVYTNDPENSEVVLTFNTDVAQKDMQK